MVFQWYALQTISSNEEKIKKLIEKMSAKWPEGNRIGQIKVPMLEMAELRNGKKKIVKKKLMPGYIFIQLEIDDLLQRKLRSVPGIMNFVCAGHEPQVLSEEEIQSLFVEMGEKVKEEKVVTRVLFSVGEIVKIIDGPFSNFQGIVDEVNPEKGKVRVRVEIFGRATPVELYYLQVGKS